jgi:hypothetical protein
MKSEKEIYINYRLSRAWDTFDEAKILVKSRKLDRIPDRDIK